MIEFGLIGFPLAHSFSQKYFSEKFSDLGLSNFTYSNFEINNINQLYDLISKHPNLSGLNITIPYKEKVIELLDDCDEVAKITGAVNTVKIFRIDEKIKLTGYNTDVFGFENSIKPLLKPHHQSALVLGTGGASKAVCYVLRNMNIDYQLISRFKSNSTLTYSELTESILNRFQLIINTTPVGTYPVIDECPSIPYQFLNPDYLCYDLIYNPEKTLFLERCSHQGAAIKNGLEMLQLQADKSWLIWNESS